MPFSEPKFSGDDGNSMVRVPGKGKREWFGVERAARLVVYVNNHDSASVKMMALLLEHEALV